MGDPAVVVPDGAYLEAVTQKRIRIFEEVQARQAIERLNIGGELIKITLPDGAIKEGKKWISTPMDIAAGISSGLAASCLIAQVNGVLWDMARPLEGDCDLKLFKFDSDEGRDTFWHSSAHILGESLERVYGCKLCIGPCTTRGEGFYYDAHYNDLALNDTHFAAIDKQAKKAVARPEKYLGDIETWNKAEQQLTEALVEFGKEWKVHAEIREAGFHVDIDMTDRTIQKKVSLRVRDRDDLSTESIADVITRFRNEVASFL
ncbi:hypothetical protein ACQ4PT_057977 [Festuca glaucescens]